MATTPLTNDLQALFDNGALPSLLNAAAAASPFVAAVLNFPIVGTLIRDGIQWCTDWLIAKGVIEVKVDVINVLDAEALAAYADQVAAIRALQTQPSITPEQQAAYVAALAAAIQNRSGVVNA